MTSCQAIFDEKPTNVCQERQKNGNSIFYKMAISNFQNVEFLTPKISIFFNKVFEKPTIFQTFQKTGIYVLELHMNNTQTKFQANSFIFV